MQFRRVLDRDQMVANTIDHAKRQHRFAAVFQQRLLERRIGPGLGHRARTDMRPDFGLEGLDNRIERRRIDIALLGQHGLERPHPQLHFREFGAVLVVVMMFGFLLGFLLHGGPIPFPESR